MSHSGGELGKIKSVMSQRLKAVSKIRNVAIVDDNDQDATHIAALIHLLLGRDVVVKRYKVVATAIFGIQKSMPDLVILDDYIPPLDRAESSVSSIRRFGFAGPFIVISGNLSRGRERDLAKLEPLGMIHKDEINSFTLTEVLVRLAVDPS